MDWKERGVTLRQRTNFPESDRTEIVIEKSPGIAWALRIRIPSWTTPANFVSINGRRLEMSGTPGSYLTLTRVWKAGDRIELTMPMRVTAEPLADDRTQQAFLFGPLVLAGQYPKTGLEDHLEHNQGPEVGEAPGLEIPSLRSNGADPVSLLRPIPGEPLTFRVAGGQRDIVLKPLNQSWQRFAVYWIVS